MQAVRVRKKEIAANLLQRAGFFSEWKFQTLDRKFGMIKTALIQSTCFWTLPGEEVTARRETKSIRSALHTAVVGALGCFHAY